MITIVQRPLSKIETSLLINDIQGYPDLMYVSEERFLNLPCAYVVEVDNQFAGVCGVYEFGSWVKLGPLVALQKYHGNGIGRNLVEKILIDFSDRNIHISSSNIKVQKLLQSLSFTELKSFLTLPNVVKKFLFRQLMTMLSLRLVTEDIRKTLKYKRGPMRWCVRYNAIQS